MFLAGGFKHFIQQHIRVHIFGLDAMLLCDFGYSSRIMGIAAGMFIAALHEMGLSTLTHTPSPMGFLRTLLQRPPNEKAMILFPVGYPADDATVPDLQRKSLDDVSVWFEPDAE